MIECGFPQSLVNVFKSGFRNMQSCVLWHNVLSQTIKTRSRVPQGNILHVNFFNIIIDCLLNILEIKSLGCNINSQFAGARV